MNTNSISVMSPARRATRLGLCAAALFGSLAMAPAQAVVVTSLTPIPVPSTFDGVYINFATGATGTTGASTSGWDFNPYNSGTALSFFWSAAPQPAGGVGVSPTGAYTAMAIGDTVSAASSFSNGTAAANTAAFQNTGIDYLGFRFYNESTASVNYGYLAYQSSGSNGFPGTILGWAYETSGAGITVAAIPEPSTTALLALGVLALGAMKLRRRS